MFSTSYRARVAVISIVLMMTLSGCFGGSGGSQEEADQASPQANQNDPTNRFSEGRVFHVEPGDRATEQMVSAMIQLRPGDVMEFGCGYFDLYHGLLIQATEDVEIRGCGKNDTVLNFRQSDNVTGLEALNVRGITVKDLTILDSPGDAFKLKGVKWGTLLGVRAMWSGGGEPINRENFRERLQVQCTQPPMN